MDSLTPSLANMGVTLEIEELANARRKADEVLGRVVRVDRGSPVVMTSEGVVRAEHATELIKGATSLSAVGDWVLLTRNSDHDRAIISEVLPRKGVFARKDPGEKTGMQVVAANVDIVFVAQSLSGRGVNPKRLERELVLAWESGATPVVLLTKADLAHDLAAQVEAAKKVAPGVDVMAISVHSRSDVDAVHKLIACDKTVVILGESGVGKSTLVNALVGDEIQETLPTRGDDKGRHTTVVREMVFLKHGGIIIDTPGMRGLALWDAEEGIALAFSEISEAAAMCKFRDCTHTVEPGCAVIRALEAGEITSERLTSYIELSQELIDLNQRQEEASWKNK